MLTFHQVSATPGWWSSLEKYPDRLVYQTDEWIRFLAETQNAVPIFAEIRDGSSVVGCFSSLMISRYGVKILGSPFPGWTTMYMGFNLEPDVPRWMAVKALERFAFHDCGCLHFEVADRLLTTNDGERLGFNKRFYFSYETDLTQSEDEIFANMKGVCRTCIRKSKKCGVVVEECAGDDSFAEDYYEQLKDVFAKQGLVPTYDLDRVRKLIEFIYPTGRLLLLRARDADGNCIATGIYPGTNKFAQFWGNASFRSGQHLRPNEALNWHALRYWRARGAERFDWGGEGEYKERYGCQKVVVHRFCQSRLAILPVLRDQARKVFCQQLRVKGWFALRQHKPV
jgi:hypothetical protein